MSELPSKGTVYTILGVLAVASVGILLTAKLEEKTDLDRAREEVLDFLEMDDGCTEVRFKGAPADFDAAMRAFLRAAAADAADAGLTDGEAVLRRSLEILLPGCPWGGAGRPDLALLEIKARSLTQALDGEAFA